MKTILCPTDFSESSENAIFYAAELARKFNSRIIIMHSYETPVIYTDVTVSTVQIDFEELKSVALSRLRKFYVDLKPKLEGIAVELILQQGLPSSRIVEIAEEKNIDMIVMSSSESNQVERILIGSNAGRVLKEAQCLLLLVPHEAKFNGFRKIVFTTDLSKENLNSSAPVVEIAAAFNSELIFLNVDNQTLIHEDTDNIAITQKIAEHVSYPEMKGYVCTDLNIADGITYFIETHKADCLAMVTHHRKFLQSLTHPSITKKIAYKTHIPLLVVHLPD